MFEELLCKIGAALAQHELPYMIIGGQAVLLYGEPRLTRDIDITLGFSTDRLPELLSVTTAMHLDPLTEDPAAFVAQTMVLPVIDNSSGIRVDFIFSFTPYEKEAIGRARKVLIMNQAVNFASPEDVIIHKLFAGRPRDLEDARIIILKNPDIDKHYIHLWLKEFDESSDRKDLVKTFNEILKDDD